MKICFLNPPWLFRLPEVDRASNLLGLLSLATAARQRGHEVQVLDALREDMHRFSRIDEGGHTYFRGGMDYSDVAQRVQPGTHCIAVGAPFTNLCHVVEQLSVALRRHHPQALITLGGGLPSASPELCQPLASVDMALTGEGDLSFFEYLEGEPAPNRSHTPVLLRGTPVATLDNLPIPDRSLVDPAIYFQRGARNRVNLRMASVFTSRGCPYHCHFCSIHSTMGQPWRARSAGLVVEELSILVQKHGVQAIDFEDDNFLVDPIRAIAILEGLGRLRRHHPGLVSCAFSNGLPVDKVTDEVADALVAAGCHKVSLPLEHGDIRIRRKMGKPLPDEEFYGAAKRLSSRGIPVEVFVMIGYPDETTEIFESGLAFVEQLGRLPHVAVNHLCPQPYPGTRLLQEVQTRGYQVDAPHPALLVGVGPVITTPLFDRAELERRIHRFRRVRAGLWSKRFPRPGSFPSPRAVSTRHGGPPVSPGTRIVAVKSRFLESLPGEHHGSFFQECHFEGKSLQGVAAMLSQFTGCHFTRADLSGMNASYSLFEACRFDAVVLRYACFVGCTLRRVDFSGLDLSGIDLTDSDLSEANLRGANLAGANLFGVDLTGTDLRDACLAGANLSGSVLGGCLLDNTSLDRLIARDCLFEDVSLRGVRGTDSALHRSRFVRCDLTDAAWRGFFGGAVFQDCLGIETAIIPQQGEETAWQEIWTGSGPRFTKPS